MDPDVADARTRRGPRTRTERARGRAGAIARTGDPAVPRRMPADRLATRRAPGPTIGTMIHDVDQLLEKLVRRDALNGSAVDLVFDAPTKDWVARRNGPTVDLYLYDIREDLAAPRPGLGGRRATRTGRVTRPPAAAAPVPARVPRHGLDPAARGRAPAAVVAAGLLPAQPDASRPRTSTAPLDEADLPVYLEVGQPADARTARSPTSGRRSAASSSRRSTSSSPPRSSSTRDA